MNFFISLQYIVGNGFTAFPLCLKGQGGTLPHLLGVSYLSLEIFTPLWSMDRMSKSELIECRPSMSKFSWLITIPQSRPLPGPPQWTSKGPFFAGCWMAARARTRKHTKGGISYSMSAGSWTKGPLTSRCKS
eukprot:Skav217410  [mRNA]  locus=scaffold2674:323697:326640:+ [translate_table: standard]